MKALNGPMRLATAAIATVILVVAYSPQSHGANSATRAAEPLTDLRSVDELRSLFNQDAGKVRLILLLSPT
ncbi:MAG TPA: hypothetical protein VE714_08770 [Gemmatimonadales bacterium]|jgi:hypothetical protein|nr:hypothetical protein [Gemmatimonadales bacterium]